MSNYNEINKYHVCDIYKDKKILNLLKSNEKFINFKKNVDYEQNVDFVKVGPYKFFPVVIDVEVLGDDKIFLLGIFFPILKTYYTIEITETSSVDYIEYVKENINDLFNYIEASSFVNYNNKNNEKAYQFLVGHNVIDYDLMVLFFMKTNLVNNENLLNEVINFSNYLIEDNSNRKTKNFYFCRTQCREFYQKAFLLDTYRCVPEDRARSLFRFKTELFFFNESYNVAPLEYDFKGVNDNTLRNTSKGLYEYNYNDLYYTWLLVFDKRVKGRLESRGLLYSNFDIKSVSFAEALVNTDAKMNTEYIVSTLNIRRSVSYSDKEKKIVNFNQLTFLYNYKYLEQYKMLFKEENLLLNDEAVDKNINLKNISLKVGVGGLHSRQLEVKRNDNLGYVGTQMLFASSTDDDLIIMLDFQSFYVNLILQLWQKIDSGNKETVLLKELNEMRLKLKKKKDPNDIIFKISTLAYTGCLNSYTSNVYNPNLYYSMTINGQLIMLEFLNSIFQVTESILEVNTDGVVIHIKKHNYNNLLSCCDVFEKEYKFKIDTREVIDCGLFFSSNKKIFFLKDGTLIKKGFGKYLSLNFEEDVLIHWLKNGLGNIKKIRTGNMNPDDVLSSIWQSFNSVVTDAINNNKLHIFFSAQTVMGTKAIAYFSKTPSNYGGLPIGTRTFLHPYPIKTLEFQNKYNRDSFYKNVAGDLDVSSYWTFFFNKFCKNFIYTLNQDLEKNKPVYINNPYVLFQQSGIDFFNFYKKNKSILNIFCNLTEKGFYLFLKDRNKKSFAKSKMAQTKLAEIYANKSIPYAEHMFKNYTQGMVEGVTIAANLQDCWKNNICCLDFDNFEKLFSKVNFDESSNLKHKNFLYFLLSIKEKGIFIYSSPTNSPFDRFKIFFKFKNKPINLNYGDFKKKNHYLNNDYGFNIEDFASIVGVSMGGLELLPQDNKYNLYEVDFNKFENFFIESDSKNILELNNSKESTYKDLLIELFEERNYRERTIYNKSLKQSGLKNMHVFNADEHDVNAKDFDEIFIGVLKKNNKLNLNLNDLKLAKEYYAYPYNGDMHECGPLDLQRTNNVAAESSVKKKSKGKGNVLGDIKMFKDIDIMPAKEYLKCVKKISTTKFSLSSIPFEEKKIILNHFVNLINLNARTEFIFEKVEDNTFIYHSRCSFDKIPDNPKQVTIYIKDDGQVNINCYHEKCKTYNKYAPLREALKKNLYAFILLNNKKYFEVIDGNLETVFNIILNDGKKILEK